jgi:hypothetical protein
MLLGPSTRPLNAASLGAGRFVNCLASQDVVVEMNDGVRELRAGKVGVRVEVRNHGEDGPGAVPPPPAGAKYFRKEWLNRQECANAWQ